MIDSDDELYRIATLASWVPHVRDFGFVVRLNDDTWDEGTIEAAVDFCMERFGPALFDEVEPSAILFKMNPGACWDYFGPEFRFADLKHATMFKLAGFVE